jgi:hypothetical protein
MSYTNGLDNPELYFQTKLYTGNGGTQSITLDGSENMQPDWVWVKQRGGTTNHKTSNSVTGATKALQPNDTDAEATDSNGITSFDSNGFSLGNGGDYNGSSNTQVAWCWKEQAGIFDIVSFTGSGSQRTVSHNLGVKPSMIIVKNRSATENWIVYDKINGAGNFMALNLTSATAASSSMFGVEPTSSVFTVGTSNATNKSSSNMIAYCFAEKQGVSSVGSYTGNGSSSGAYIHLGFSASWFMLKKTNATDDWHIFDNKRNTFNVVDENLRANLSNAEFDTGVDLDFTSAGVKLRNTDDNGNGSGDTYIYLAFSETPFTTSSGTPTTAR